MVSLEKKKRVAVVQRVQYKLFWTYNFLLGICTSDFKAAFLGTLCLINVGCLLVALWQAYEARNVSTDLQESSYIFMAMALILIVTFVGVPVTYIAHENSLAIYFVTTGIIFTICTSIMVLIYVPKYKALKKRQKMNPARDSFVSSTSSDGEGINIVWSPEVLAELESKVAKLTKENAKMKSEIEEMKELLKTEGISQSS
jgi:hypothetical protein